MSYLTKIYLTIFGFFLIASCNNKQAKISTGIEGTSWILQSMSGQIPSGVEIDLQFEKDKINGKGVCNRYFANYKLSGQQITFQSVGSTKMMCPEHSDLETKYFDALQNAEAFSIQDGELTIKTKDVNLVFKPTSRNSSMGAVKSGPSFSGQYYTASLDQYWQSLAIYPDGEKYQVVFSASTVADEPACFFQGVGHLEGSKLVIPLVEKGDQTKMVITKKEKAMEVITEAATDRLALLYYCSGGASLAGTYVSQSDLMLSENQLGSIELKPGIIINEKILAAQFPDLQVVREIGQGDRPNFTYYSLKNTDEATQMVVDIKSSQQAQELNSVKIYTPDIPDQYGIRSGMTYAQAKKIRPSLRLITNTHFHTYAFDDASHIKYEICCNTDQIDKTTWSEQEVGNWKINSLIWEAAKEYI